MSTKPATFRVSDCFQWVLLLGPYKVIFPITDISFEYIDENPNKIRVHIRGVRVGDGASKFMDVSHEAAELFYKKGPTHKPAAELFAMLRE